MNSTSTSSRPGTQAPGWANDCLAENQQPSQLTLRHSKPEGTDTQEQVIPSPGEKGYYRLRALESWFMIGLLYRMLKSLIDFVLLRRLEQSEAKIPADPQPERRTGIHIRAGNRTKDACNIRGANNTTINLTGMRTGDGIAIAGVLKEHLGAPDPLILEADDDAQRVGNVWDAGNLNIKA